MSMPERTRSIGRRLAVGRASFFYLPWERREVSRWVLRRSNPNPSQCLPPSALKTRWTNLSDFPGAAASQERRQRYGRHL